MQEVIEINDENQVIKIDPTIEVPEQNEIFTCSFCLHKTSEDEATKIIKGPQGNICADCVSLCNELLCPEIKTVKCSANIECPYCKAYWAKTEEATCHACKQKFFVEH